MLKNRCDLTIEMIRGNDSRWVLKIWRMNAVYLGRSQQFDRVPETSILKLCSDLKDQKREGSKAQLKPYSLFPFFP